MIVEIISVGTEILLGNIVNTNAAFLSEECAGIGLSCYYQSVVGDNEERLSGLIKDALGRSDIILLSGGLGPTEDDLTKETVAKVLGLPMVMDEASKQHIQDYFSKKKMKISNNNWKQAMIPEGAIVLPNPNGTAPGIIVEAQGKSLILMPGPPNELIPMFKDQIKPYLNKKQPGTILSQTVKLCGVSESDVETQLLDLIQAQTNPTLATYAKTGEVHIRVTAKANDESEALRLLKPTVKEIKKRFGASIYTTDENTSLEQAVVDLLLAKQLTLSTIESCTGGMLAARIINIPGVSEVFKTGLITYSNKSKKKIVGVRKSTLDKHGAVSEHVAKEMANGGADITKSNVAVSITGIAGPDGGTKEKPVGLVYIGCHVCDKVTVKEYRFSGNRSKIRESTVSAALCLMRQCILEYYSETTFGDKK